MKCQNSTKKKQKLKSIINDLPKENFRNSFQYASLYFCCAVENQDNELLTLEIVHLYVELLDKYFGNVCELDIIFNLEKAYFILDEFIIGGKIQETFKKAAVKAIEESDMLKETMEE
uniref:AP complex mu/sigma subunit domain-containing protein n=1 Tax=Castor canadensis TaxID=51338 RepID=A0A8C0W7I2_CASCN